MELLNPHRSRVGREEMKQLQEVQESTRPHVPVPPLTFASSCFQTINASSDKIRVRDLQVVSR